MIVYRVYQPYHDSSESGTTEYGYFSSLDRAKDLVARLWKEKKYPDGYEDGPSGRWVRNGWDSCSIHIREIEIDKEIKDNCCGYT